jgi:hypothetical protein
MPGWKARPLNRGNGDGSNACDDATANAGFSCMIVPFPFTFFRDELQTLDRNSIVLSDSLSD